jgi:DNA-binding response OmpR family regulator
VELDAAELVARVRAKLRRAEPAPEEPRIRLDGLEVDLAARVLRHDDVETHLTRIEFKLLRELLDYRGRPLSQEFLLRRLWGPALSHDTQTLRVHISNLRRKMRPFEDHIRTTHGVGYRFVERPWRRPIAPAPRHRDALGALCPAGRVTF